MNAEDDLHLYRAHRFGIIKLDDGSFALFTPDGNLTALGSIDELVPLILTGPEAYELAVDNWIGRGRPTAESNTLLATLGLLKPTAPIKRRM